MVLYLDKHLPGFRLLLDPEFASSPEVWWGRLHPIPTYVNSIVCGGAFEVALQYDEATHRGAIKSRVELERHQEVRNPRQHERDSGGGRTTELLIVTNSRSLYLHRS